MDVRVSKSFPTHAGAKRMRDSAIEFAAAAGVGATHSIDVVDSHGNPYGSKGTKGKPTVVCTVILAVPETTTERA